VESHIADLNEQRKGRCAAGNTIEAQNHTRRNEKTRRKREEKLKSRKNKIKIVKKKNLN